MASMDTVKTTVLIPQKTHDKGKKVCAQYRISLSALLARGIELVSEDTDWLKEQKAAKDK